MRLKTWLILPLLLLLTKTGIITSALVYAGEMKLQDFLSGHSSEEKVVNISIEPDTVYFEEGRNARYLNFDLVVEGLTNKELIIEFIKVGVYDVNDRLLTFRHLNHNGVETPGIRTIGKYTISGKEKFDIFNPFYEFPAGLKISYLRFTFTFAEKGTDKEYYYGNIIVRPKIYEQKVTLSVPLKGLMVVTDGHDYYSHHRRFGMTIVRSKTNNTFQSNFARFSLDLTLIGDDGNMRKMDEAEKRSNYDFHFTDIRKFYSQGTAVFSPADGKVVDIVNDMDDLYDRPFDLPRTIKNGRVRDIAGNFVIIKHNDHEFSHLFHLEKGSINVYVGQKVKRGQEIGRIGFSGTASLYSHLHYQLMNGMDFLKDEALPFRFSDVTLIVGDHKKRYKTVAIDTGDLILN